VPSAKRPISRLWQRSRRGATWPGAHANAPLWPHWWLNYSQALSMTRRSKQRNDLVGMRARSRSGAGVIGQTVRFCIMQGHPRSKPVPFRCWAVLTAVLLCAGLLPKLDRGRRRPFPALGRRSKSPGAAGAPR